MADDPSKDPVDWIRRVLGWLQPTPGIKVDGPAYMVVAGLQFEVTSVVLADGRIKFVGWRDGPVKATRGYLTMFGSDGSGIFQSAELWDVPAARTGDRMKYVCDMRMDGISALVPPSPG